MVCPAQAPTICSVRSVPNPERTATVRAWNAALKDCTDSSRVQASLDRPVSTWLEATPLLHHAGTEEAGTRTHQDRRIQVIFFIRPYCASELLVEGCRKRRLRCPHEEADLHMRTCRCRWVASHPSSHDEVMLFAHKVRPENLFRHARYCKGCFHNEL